MATKLSAIADGGAVAGATDKMVTVRSGTTDLLTTPVALDTVQTWSAAQAFGTITATTINKLTITAPSSSATLTIANAKTLTVSNTLTFTGTDSSSVAFGAGGTVAYTGGTLAQFAATTSLQLLGVISDETGSGSLVFATTPTLVTPVLGVATATTINKITLTAPASGATLTLTDGKTLAVTNTLTLSGTDSTTITFQGTDTYVGRTTTDTLTNKTLTSPVMTTPTLGVASATSLALSGTGGAGFVELPNQASAPSTPSSASRLYVDSSNRLSWKGTNGFARTFDGTANVADRVYVLPDVAGTMLLNTSAVVGTGDGTATVAGGTWRGPAAVGTNVTCASIDCTYDAPQSTGTGLGGNHILRVANKGSTGTTANAMGAVLTLAPPNTGTTAVVNGLTITGAITTGAVGIAVTGTDTNPALNIDSKGSGVLTLNGTSNGQITLHRTTQIDGNTNIIANLMITRANANALAVGANGTTNPALQIDTATTSVATGIKITGAAAAGGVAIAAISSGTDESMTFDAKGAGTVTINGTATGGITLGQNVTVTEAKNIVLGTTTGSKIGTATTQKIGFYNATPVVQQTDGAAITNNVTVGGTTNTIADITDQTIYANDAAAIRNNIYQIARKVKIVDDALRTYGLLS